MEPYLGEIAIFPYAFIPKDWHACDGSTLPIVQNQALFSLLGVQFGGDGKTTFALPDLRGRVPLGSVKVGQYGGAETVTLTQSTMPGHSHFFQVASAAGDLTTVTKGIYASVQEGKTMYAPPSGTTQSLDPKMMASVGGGGAHSNLQPYTALCYCIAMTGIYPART